MSTLLSVLSISRPTLLLTLLLISTNSDGFNIDSTHPIILSNGGGGYFGQSIQLVKKHIIIKTNQHQKKTSTPVRLLHQLHLYRRPVGEERGWCSGFRGSSLAGGQGWQESWCSSQLQVMIGDSCDEKITKRTKIGMKIWLVVLIAVVDNRNDHTYHQNQIIRKIRWIWFCWRNVENHQRNRILEP